MINLRKFVSPEFIFGPGALDLAGQYSKKIGAQKVLVVSDQGVMNAGWTQRVMESLESVNLPHELFCGISPNPRVDEVMAGVDFYESKACDVIVAVGGGSPIDCAKGIGVASSNGVNILEFEGVDEIDLPGPPLICIPTTAGASADVSQFAIINNIKEKIEIAIISKKMVPDVALIDPVPTTTMDSYLTACTGVDALIHAMEAFVSLANSPVFDLHALKAVSLIRNHLTSAIHTPDSLEHRTHMMLGSLEAGLAFSNASLGAVHAMAHSLGGFLDLPHGELNGMLLEHVVAFNYDAVPERYGEIAKAMGLDLKNMTGKEKRAAFLNGIRQFKHAAGITGSLKDIGVRKSDIPELARKAFHDACIVTNPRRPSIGDIEVIYEEAL